MKTYFKSFLLVMLAAIGFTACTDQFDEDEGFFTYPATLALGEWKSEYTPETDVNNYGLKFELSEAGDTICTLTTTNKLSDLVQDYTNGTVSYNPEVGIATVQFDSSNTPTHSPYTLYFCFQNGCKRASCKMYIISGDNATRVFTFPAIPAN